MKRFIILLLLLCVPSLLGACTSGESVREQAISRDRFIAVNVALRQIDPEGPKASERRDEVLREHGVTTEQLREFVERRENRPGELAEIWEEIARRTDRVRDLEESL